jgi:hypothetical protein
VNATAWTDYDEGYLRAQQWASTLAKGGALPVETSPVALEPGETAHGHFSPVAFASFFSQATQYQPSFFVFGGPVGLAVTASVQYGRDAAYRAQAQRAGVPQWHPLGAADVVVTTARLIVTGKKQTGSLPYARLGAFQLVPGIDGGPAVQLQPTGEPALQLSSPWAPVLYVFMRYLTEGTPPQVPIPAAVLERAQAEGRI